MKRIFTALLAVCILLAMGTTVLADIIWEPAGGNEFLNENLDACQGVYRRFTVSAPQGVQLLEAPGEGSPATKLKAGEVVTISYSYAAADGTWGFVELSDWEGGWLPMGTVTLLYDYISFAEEHGGEFYPYTGDAHTRLEPPLYLWAYPGSPVLGIEEELHYSEGAGPGIVHAYKDAEGREWGFVEYDFGYEGVWLCLSDPGGKTLDTTGNPNTGAKSGGGMTPVIALVAAVVALTAVLIGVLGSRRKKGA